MSSLLPWRRSSDLPKVAPLVRLPARLAIAFLAAFTVLDIAILLGTGHSTSPSAQLLDRIVADTSSARAPAGAPSPAAGRSGSADAVPQRTGKHAAPRSTVHAAAPQAVGDQRQATSLPAKRKPAGANRAPAKARPKHQQPVIPPRRAPGPASRSHYLRTLTGGLADTWRMYTLGRTDAAQHASGTHHVVLLDIGGQVSNGVHLSTTRTFISYPALRRAVVAYVMGYHSAQRANAPVVIGVGTNNDLVTSFWAGWLWGREVVDKIIRATRGFPNIQIVGADDIEPTFLAGPRNSRSWVTGYLHGTSAPLINNGSADGCSWTRTHSRCNNGWNARDLAFVSGAWSPRITVLPQIYNTRMAGQWAQVSLTAARDGGRPLRFWGPLTENAACAGDRNCPTMPSVPAWNALWRSLHGNWRTAPHSLPTRTDLDVR